MDSLARALALKFIKGKADLVNGKIPADQLPAYVSQIVEVNTYSDLPAQGQTNVIYVVKQPTQTTYRWTGTGYISTDEKSQYYSIKVSSTAITTMGALRTYINNINSTGLHCLFDFSEFIGNGYVCTVLMFTQNNVNYAVIFDVINGRTYVDYSGYQDSETVQAYVNRLGDNIPRIITISDANITVQEIADLLTDINVLGHHVLFDLHVLGAGCYLCTISIDSTNVKVFDVVGNRSVSTTFTSTTTLASVLTNLASTNITITEKGTSYTACSGTAKDITVGNTTFSLPAFNAGWAWTAFGKGAEAWDYSVAIGASASTRNKSVAIGQSAFANHKSVAVGKATRAEVEPSVAIGEDVVNKIPYTVQFDNPSNNYTLNLYDPSKIFFRNENIDNTKTTLAAYTNGKTLQDLLNEVGSINIINASDITNNTLTQAQYNLMINGKPTLIKGNLLNKIDAVYFCPKDVYSRWLFGVIYTAQGDPGYHGFAQAQIWQDSRVIQNIGNPIFEIAYYSGLMSLNVSRLNYKNFPAYPSSPSNTKVLACKTDNNLAWVDMPAVVSDTSSTSISISLESNKTYQFTQAVTSIAIQALSTQTGDNNPMWSLDFIAGSGLNSISFPSGLTIKWANGTTPTFASGKTYTLMIKPGLENSTYLAMLGEF